MKYLKSKLLYHTRHCQEKKKTTYRQKDLQKTSDKGLSKMTKGS